MIPEPIEKILLKVQKPSRYTGGELNGVIKPDASFRMAISYPDLYEVAMSNNGIKILYDRVNAVKGAACERVFAVAPDFESILRENKLPLYTLETFTPLRELDCVGFNVSHEMLATNILQILDLGGVPLLREDRTEGDPVILAGGEAVSNPFPLSDFIDIFFLGDGEDAVVEIAALFLRGKSEAWTRQRLIDELGKIEGVMNPAEYTFTYEGAEALSLEGREVQKRVYRGSEPSDPVAPLVPSMRITQERAVLEVNRGCYNLCKFCHAGYYTLPYRAFDVARIEEKTFETLKNTGYSELTLASLSVSDYRDLVALLNRMLPRLNEEGVSISLPSLKVDSTTLEIIEVISDVRKSSLTFAVEAGSRSLREKINKKVYEEELLEIVDYVFSKGWRVLKLFFMIGLPGSRDEDEAESIIELLKKIRTMGKRKGEINVTVSPFIPKPHTPFEREEQRDEEYFRDIVLRVKQGLPRSIKIKSHDLRLSVLEGIFARGDARLGAAVLKAYNDGCRLDSWREYFKPADWFAALDKTLPAWRDYLGERGEDKLPWEWVSTGFEKLKNNWRDRCIDLGEFDGPKWRYRDALDRDAIQEGLKKFEKRFEVKGVLRLRLSKLGPSRYLSHLDFLEVIRRALRMADMPVAFSQGFNKRERIAAGFPVPLGIESESEILDIDLYDFPGEEVFEKLRKSFPEGIDYLDSEIIEEKGSIMGKVRGILYRVEGDSRIIAALDEAARSAPSFFKKTKKGTAEIPFDDAVLSWIVLEDGAVDVEMITDSSGTVRIDVAIPQLAEKGGVSIEDVTMVKKGQYMLNDQGERIFM